MERLVTAVALVSCLGACSHKSLNLDRLACDAGQCADGFVCHPETNQCVVPFSWDCAADPLTCPTNIGTGDGCPSPGSFVPCDAMVADCSAGCRTCGDDGTWSACSGAAGDGGGGPDGGGPGDALVSAGDLNAGGGDPNASDASMGDLRGGDTLMGDANVSDNAMCVPMATQACPSTFGLGTRTCQMSSMWGMCVPDWSFRVRIDLDGSGLSAPLSGVPILLVLNNSVISNYGSIGSGGVDLLFMDADDTTQLAFEIEEWDAGGDSYVWVRVPQLDPGTSDFIYMYYGNGSALSRENPVGVWSSQYQGVWHLAEDAAGVGNLAVYIDSTSNARHADDNVASTTKTGLAGPGQDFDQNDRIVIPNHPAFTPSAVTLELAAFTQPVPWSHKTVFTLSPASPMNDFQVMVTLDVGTFNYATTNANGDDLRFYDQNGTSLPYWIERWDPAGASWIWVLTRNGTTTINMFHGNPAAPAQSNAGNVLDNNGLWATFWDHGGASHPNNIGEMDSLFAGLDFSSREGWGRINDIDCRNDCDPHQGNPDDDYAVLFEGWIDVNNGSNGFASNSDDASDIHIDGTAWKSSIGGTRVVDFYGSHGFATNLWDNNARLTLTGGLHRYVYRMEEGGGGDGYEAGLENPGGGTNWFIIGQNRFFHRKRADPQPVASFVGTIQISSLILKAGAYALACGGSDIIGIINNQRVTATASPNAWHALALVYDGANVILYVDGAEVDRAAYTMPINLNPNAIGVGELIDDLLEQAGPLDEVRISSVARTPDWLLIQARSLQDNLVTVQAFEIP